MEKEKAIEIFNKWMDCKDAYQADPSCDGNCFSCEYYASAEEEKEAMQMAISALEKQEQDRWIPVTERLPKSKPDDLEYPTVLVSFSNGEVCTACYYESTKEWGTGEDYNRICYPIAWRPLPEPYTEEEA